MSTKVEWSCWAVLLLSFGIGCLTIYWGGPFVDEGDNLVIGSLLSRQNLLYRDFFSHHFPFPYFWVAIFVNSFGRSIFLIRLSIWLFQIISFAIAMKMSRFYLPLAIAAFVWSILRGAYYGNMVLYSSFAGPSIMVVFAISLAILLEKRAMGWTDGLVIGVFSAIALLSDPLSAYAVAVALLFILGQNLRQGMLACLMAGSVVLSFGGYLFASGTFWDFWQNAILFNVQIYSKYLSEPYQHMGILEFFQMVGKGLEVADRRWLDFSPLKPLLVGHSDFDRWVFTGFLYRAGLILGASFLALKRKYSAAIFVYLFAAATLVSAEWGFRAQPFILVAILVVSATIIGEWRYPENRIINLGQKLVRVLLGTMVVWLMLRVVNHYYVNRTMLTYEANFGWFEREAERIKAYACNQPGVQLAFYPGGTYFHWLTRLKPLSKYTYMWPWVAEVGLSDVIEELDQDRVLAIVVHYAGILWSTYNSKEYLRPMDEYLSSNYKYLADGVYLSPRLYKICKWVENK